MKTIKEQLVRTIDLVNLCSETDIYSVYVNERNICIRCNYAPSMTNMLVNVGFEYSIDVYGYLHFKRNGDEHIIMMNELLIEIKDINKKIEKVKNIIEKYELLILLLLICMKRYIVKGNTNRLSQKN